MARTSARAVLLANGTVLAMGGCISSDCLVSTTTSAEIYNPSTVARDEHLATRQEYGKELR